MVLIMCSEANRNWAQSFSQLSGVWDPLTFAHITVFSRPAFLCFASHDNRLTWLWHDLYFHVLYVYSWQVRGQPEPSWHLTVLVKLKLVLCVSCCCYCLYCNAEELESFYLFEFEVSFFVWQLPALSVGWNCNRLLVNKLCSEMLGYQGLLSSCLLLVNVTILTTLTM